MHKERSRRYSTADELAEDIHNYLGDRPLRAGPESAAYRTRKFLHRNQVPVAVAAGMLLLLVGGIATTTWQAVRATRAQRAARTLVEELRLQKMEVERANSSMSAVNEFLTQEVLISSTPEVTRGRTLTVLEALDNAARRIKGNFDQSPSVEASVRSTLSRAYQSLGRPDLALPHARAAGELCERALPAGHAITLGSMNQLAHVLEDRGDYAAAEAIYRDALTRVPRDSKRQSEYRLTLIGNLGRTLQKQGRLEEAEPLCRESAQGLGKLRGDDDALSLDSLSTLGVLLDKQGRAAEAEALLRRVLQARLRTQGQDHPDTLAAGSNLANVLIRQGNLNEADALLRDAVALTRRVCGENHSMTITAINSYARVQQLLGRLDEAEALLRESLEKSRRALDDDNPVTLTVMNNLAALLKGRGKVDEAIELYREALDRHRRGLGAEHPNTILSMNNLGQALSAKGRHAEAEPLFAEVFRCVPGLEMDPKTSAVVMSRWGPCLVELGRFGEAEAPLREAHRRLSASGQTQTGAMATVLEALAKVCEQTNRPDEAAEWRQRRAAWHPATSQSAASRPSTSRGP
jgi:tetratricopeptide (TPR) repeat protein